MRQGSKIIATVVGIALAAACSRDSTDRPQPQEGQDDPLQAATIDASTLLRTAEPTPIAVPKENDQQNKTKPESPKVRPRKRKATKNKSSRSSFFNQCVKKSIKESVAYARAKGGLPNLVDAERFANAACNLEADKQRQWDKKADDYERILKKYE